MEKEYYFLVGRSGCVPQENSVLFPYSKSFIDQACSVQMAGYWPRYFFASLDLDSVRPRLLGPERKKKNLANISSHLYLTLGQ